MKTIIIRPKASSTIFSTVLEAKGLANKTTKIEFTFNGIPIVVTEATSAQDILDQYRADLDILTSQSPAEQKETHRLLRQAR